MQAETFEQWQAYAAARDKRSGADRWRENDKSSLYDHKVIRYRHDELVNVRKKGKPDRLLYYLNEGLHGNMGGMGNPALYVRALSGTKHLISKHLSELVLALDDLEHADETIIPRDEKLAYFRRAAACFGRSALMFSGAGSLGAFHIGVAQELLAQDLMPRVVSGASAGSMVAALIGTHAQQATLELLTHSGVRANFKAVNDAEEAAPRPRRISQADLIDAVHAIIPDLTFAEALEESGIYLNVCVAPSELNQRSRMLNAATAPNAFIREAVTASCSIPGVFPPVTLMARDGRKRRPYVASRKWVDGSITDDQPAKRLARQYGVNHFISSQANPLVVWGLNPPGWGDNVFTRVADIMQRGMRDGLRTVYPTVMDAVRKVHPINTYTRFWFSVLTQEYTADINLIPPPNVLHPCKVLSHLSERDTNKLIMAGRRATWPKVEMIRNCTKVSRCIDEALLRLEPAGQNV